MVAQIFLVTSVRGGAFAPMRALRVESGCMGFLNDEFGARYLAAFLSS